jgi:TorA maturation chaperone TorD
VSALPVQGGLNWGAKMTGNENILFKKDEAVSDAEIDRAVYRLLAAFYNYNPDKNFLEALLNLSAEDVAEEKIADALKSISEYARKAVDSEEMITELKRDWTRLFRGVSPDYGAKPPYEQLFMKSASLELISELAQEYICNGFAEYMEINNRHDYLGTELSYAAHLASLRITALETGNFEEYVKYQEMFDVFVRKHLSGWAEIFCKDAEKYATTDFYKGVLKFTALTITTEGVSDEFLF